MMRASAPPAEPGIADIHLGISDYYTAKLRRFGATPLGVDWSCEATQQMRFAQLLRICDFDGPFQLNDFGCGYGALLTYLEWRHAGCEIDYLGIDVSAGMIRRARRIFRQGPLRRFIIGHRATRVADYSVASGIFNVRNDCPLAAWEAFIRDTLQCLHDGSRRGFAVNFASCPDGQQPRPGLYVTEPERWMEYCRQSFGTSAEVIDGYGLREFSLLIRKPSIS